MLIRLSIAFLLALFVADAAAQNVKLMNMKLTNRQFNARRWPYPLHTEVSSHLHDVTHRYPRIARLHNIGKSVQGRDLWVLEITNSETGPGESKPGLWIDGNLHPDELPGRRYLKYFIERVVTAYGKDPVVTRLVDTRTFYIIPILNPDAGDFYLSRQPSWPEHKPEQHAGTDLDGDGYITRMRVRDESDPDGYRYYIEGQDITRKVRGGYERYREITGEREPTDFNRNWSAEWRSEEPGGGSYPFSQPEIYAAAKFITDHKNIFFQYSIHTGGGIKNYMVRPLFNHPYQAMHHEDNDFYVRLGAVWAQMSDGGLMQNNFYSFWFTGSRVDDEGHQMGYIATMAGFAGDWGYQHQGIHTLTPECSGVGIDYNQDGYITQPEIMRWNEEEEGGRFFAPWTKFSHPELGQIEIGGDKDMPQAFGDRLLEDAEVQYRFLMHISNLAPELRIADLSAVPLSAGRFRVSAKLRNNGWLSTYVTRRAIEIRRDYPVVANIEVNGGELVEGAPVVKVGHILGKFAYIDRFDDDSELATAEVEWTVRPTGSGPLKVTLTGWAHKAGRDQRTITIRK